VSSLGSSDFDQQNADDLCKNTSPEKDIKRNAKQKTNQESYEL
jgi:hypothetical protein